MATKEDLEEASGRGDIGLNKEDAVIRAMWRDGVQSIAEGFG